MNPKDTSLLPAPPPARGFAVPRQELFVVLAYVVFATIWIRASDHVVESLTGDPHHSAQMQTFKGINFVLTTALLLYFVLARSYRRRRRAEAKQLEAQRKEREIAERYELIARAASDALWDWNLQNNEITWGDGFQKLFGHPKEEVEPTIESWTSRIHPEDRERTVRKIHRVIDSGETAWWDDYRFLKRDGTYASVMDRGYVIRDENGKPTRMVGGITDVTRQKEAERELIRSRQRLQKLSVRLETLREAEHSRISRQIHDELGQQLTGLKMDLRWIEKRLEAHGPELNPILDKAVEASELADRAITSVQDISAELRPGLLDHLDLPTALTHEAGTFQERNGIQCNVEFSTPPPEVPEDYANTIFRIVREALTNVLRHANATEVRISLREDERGFVLTITDNGQGMSMEVLENPNSIGLFGMKERASPLGGDVTFGHAPDGRGTSVTLRLPWPKATAPP